MARLDTLLRLVGELLLQSRIAISRFVDDSNRIRIETSAH